MFNRQLICGLLLASALAGCSKASKSGTPTPSGDVDQQNPPSMPSDAFGVGGKGGEKPETETAAGTSSKPTEPTKPKPEQIPQTCDELASVACDALQACAPFLVTTSYGSVEECTRVIASVCEHYESGKSGIDREGCAQALGVPQCSAIKASAGIPTVCRTPRGAHAAGAECGRNADCASLSCQKKGACGVCLEHGAVGAVCTGADECELGLVCNLGSCAEPVAPGAACDVQKDLRCPPGSTCAEGKCQPDGGEGAACDALKRCDRAQGFACRNGSCVAQKGVAAGESCGASSNGECVQGTCSGAWAELSCVAASDLRGPCNPGVCRAPYACVSGKCAIEEVGSCK